MGCACSQTKIDFRDNEYPDMEFKLDEYKAALEEGKIRRDVQLNNFDPLGHLNIERNYVSALMNSEIMAHSPTESKIYGMLVGATVGESLGLLLEGSMLQYERNYFNGFENAQEIVSQEDKFQSLPVEVGNIGAGTSMSLCLADSIIKNGKFDGKDVRFRFILWWYAGYNNCRKIPASSRLDAFITESFQEFIKTPCARVKANGKNFEGSVNSLLRVPPIVIQYIHDRDKCMSVAYEQNFTTNESKESAECCRLLAYILWELLNTNSTEKYADVIEKILKNFSSDCYSVECLAKSQGEDEQYLSKYDRKKNKYPRDRNWNWKDPQMEYSQTRCLFDPYIIGKYCMDALAMALNLNYFATNYEQAVLNAANLGASSSGVTMLAGMIAGAYYGCTSKMKEWYNYNVYKYDKLKTPVRAYFLYESSNEGSEIRQRVIEYNSTSKNNGKDGRGSDNRSSNIGRSTSNTANNYVGRETIDSNNEIKQ